jgi:hypothetical protein
MKKRIRIIFVQAHIMYQPIDEQGAWMLEYWVHLSSGTCHYHFHQDPKNYKEQSWKTVVVGTFPQYTQQA